MEQVAEHMAGMGQGRGGRHKEQVRLWGERVVEVRLEERIVGKGRHSSYERSKECKEDQS